MYKKSVETKLEKIDRTLTIYRQYKDKVSSIRDLVPLTGYSKSSIQRYLQAVKFLEYVPFEEYEEIQNWLKQNKELGNASGGLVSQEKYGYSKDELGHFKGGKRNG